MTVPILFELPALIIMIISSSYGASYFLARIFHGRRYRYLIAPGIIVHEYSHAAACVLTGAPIREIRVFDKRGGAVAHGTPRIPFGQAIISFAPIAGAALCTALLARLLIPDLLAGDWSTIASWQFMAFAYLASAITVCMAPSGTDVWAGLWAFLGLWAIGLMVSISETASEYIGFLVGDTGQAALTLMRFSVVVLLAILMVSGLAYLLLHRGRRQGVRYDTVE